MEGRGETHLIRRDRCISDTLVNYLIGVSLDVLKWTGETEISPDLIFLIKHQLGTINSEFDARQVRTAKKRDAAWIAAQIAAAGGVPSYRKIAKRMGVDATTVMRWFAGDDMITRAKELAASILANRTEVAREISRQPV